MRIVWLTLVGLVLLVSLGSSIADEVTLTTYYPSPRAAYDDLRANVYRDLGDPSNRFLDPTATSQLQSVQFFGPLTLAGRTISKWEHVLPSGSVLLFALPTCPDGYTPLTSTGQFPRIGASPGSTGGGDTITGTPDALTGAGGPWSVPGGKHGGGASSVNTQVASSTHRHPVSLPLYRDVVLCQRN